MKKIVSISLCLALLAGLFVNPVYNALVIQAKAAEREPARVDSHIPNTGGGSDETEDSNPSYTYYSDDKMASVTAQGENLVITLTDPDLQDTYKVISESYKKNGYIVTPIDHSWIVYFTVGNKVYHANIAINSYDKTRLGKDEISLKEVTPYLTLVLGNGGTQGGHIKEFTIEDNTLIFKASLMTSDNEEFDPQSITNVHYEIYHRETPANGSFFSRLIESIKTFFTNLFENIKNLFSRPV